MASGGRRLRSSRRRSPPRFDSGHPRARRSLRLTTKEAARGSPPAPSSVGATTAQLFTGQRRAAHVDGCDPARLARSAHQWRAGAPAVPNRPPALLASRVARTIGGWPVCFIVGWSRVRRDPRRARGASGFRRREGMRSGPLFICSSRPSGELACALRESEGRSARRAFRGAGRGRGPARRQRRRGRGSPSVRARAGRRAVVLGCGRELDAKPRSCPDATGAGPTRGPSPREPPVQGWTSRFDTGTSKTRFVSSFGVCLREPQSSRFLGKAVLQGPVGNLLARVPLIETAAFSCRRSRARCKETGMQTRGMIVADGWRHLGYRATNGTDVKVSTNLKGFLPDTRSDHSRRPQLVGKSIHLGRSGQSQAFGRRQGSRGLPPQGG